MTTQTTTDLFEGFKALANAVTAGLGDEDADERLTSALFYIADEIRRRLADDRSPRAEAMRAEIRLFEEGGLSSRDAGEPCVGSAMKDQERQLLLAVIERANREVS